MTNRFPVGAPNCHTDATKRTHLRTGQRDHQGYPLNPLMCGEVTRRANRRLSRGSVSRHARHEGRTPAGQLPDLLNSPPFGLDQACLRTSSRIIGANSLHSAYKLSSSWQTHPRLIPHKPSCCCRLSVSVSACGRPRPQRLFCSLEDWTSVLFFLPSAARMALPNYFSSSSFLDPLPPLNFDESSSVPSSLLPKSKSLLPGFLTWMRCAR